MGGGASRQSYEEYLNKRRSKELLFYDNNSICQVKNQPKWGRRLSIPSMNNRVGISINSSIDSLPASRPLGNVTKSMLSPNRITSPPPPKKQPFFSSPSADDDDIVQYTDTPISGSSNSSEKEFDKFSNSTLSTLQPKYALVRRKSKSSDATRTAIRKL